MKKIFISIISFILALSMFCVTAFALPQNFSDVVGLDNVYIYGLTAGTDYKQTITSTSQYEEAKAYAVEQGVPTYDRFVNRFFFYVSYDDTSLAQLGSVNTPFYSGYYVHATMDFKLYSDFSSFEFVTCKIQTNQEVGMWNWSKMDTAGAVTLLGIEQDSDGHYFHRARVTISYKNEGETISGYPVRFLICARSSESKPLYASVYTYTPYVYEYYYGDGSEPNAPVYTDPDSLDNGTLDNYYDQEQDILDKAQEGQAYFGNAVSDIGGFLAVFAAPLSAISSAMNWSMEEVPFLEYLIRIGLALGLVGFVLNLISMVVRASRRRE